MAEGWWVSFALTVSWFGVGLLIYMFQRDKARKKAEQELAKDRKRGTANSSAGKPGAKGIRVKDLEKYFDKKG